MAKFVNGCFISNREIERDTNFLKTQNLSDKQISAVTSYYYKRITASGNKAGILAIVLFTIGYLLAGF